MLNYKLSVYNGSSIPVIQSCSLNISTKHELHSVQFTSIKGLKTSTQKRLSSINVKTQSAFTCSNLTIETLEQGVRHVQT